MIWQDAVITTGNAVLAIGLLPTVFGESKPAPMTSGVTATMLAVQMVAVASLDLWFAAASLAVASFLWAVLLVQALRKRPRDGALS